MDYSCERNTVDSGGERRENKTKTNTACEGGKSPSRIQQAEKAASVSSATVSCPFSDSKIGVMDT